MGIPERPYIPWQEAISQGSRVRAERIEGVRQAWAGSKKESSRAFPDSFWETHQNSLATVAAILGVPMGLSFLSACSQPPAIVREATPTPTSSQESGLKGVKTPIWNRSDLEYIKEGNRLGPGVSFSMYLSTLSERPPFYRGPMPLSFNKVYSPSGEPGQLGGAKPIIYVFENFYNAFIYKGQIIIGAQTYSRGGEPVLLAEVSNIRYFVTEKNTQGIEIEELHYGPDGKLMFKGKSRIDPNFGFKLEEVETIGKKSQEYYNVWPVER